MLKLWSRITKMIYINIKHLLFLLYTLLILSTLIESTQHLFDDVSKRLLTTTTFKSDVLRRYPRQIVVRDGAVIKEWWLVLFYKLFPSLFRDENSVPTPIMFLPYTDDLVSKILKTLIGWWPTISYEDHA